MRHSADVKSIDALKDAKAALAEFRNVARIALAEAFSDVQRPHSWLQGDRRTWWQAEVRRRQEKVNQAKSDLYRAQLAAMDDRPSCIEQRKQLQRSERALEEAHRKVELVRKWTRVLDREMLLFRGKCQPIARAVDGDLAKGEARLEVLLDDLDAYVRLQAPASGPPRPASGGGDQESASS